MGSYNRMDHIPFDEVCENRSTIVPIISDNNDILRETINYCVDRYLIDKSIETYECCEGEESDTDFDYDDTYYSTYIMFNVPIGSELYIHSILKSIKQFSRAKYAIAQNRRDKTLLLDVRQSYSDRKSANQFLEAIKEGTINYKNCDPTDLNVSNIINLFKNTNHPIYDLIISGNMKKNNYSIMYVNSYGGSPLNISPIDSVSLSSGELAEFDAEKFMNNGISRVKRLH